MTSEPTTFDRTRSHRILKFAEVASMPTAFVARHLAPFDADSAFGLARRLTGLYDFGEPDITQPVDLITEGVRESPHVTAFGELLERDILNRLLMSRLHIVEYLKTNPAVNEIVPERPIFIIGLPRTGTTLLHHLLASHPDVREIHGWESMNPLPGRSNAARRRKYAMKLGFIKTIAPEAFAVHPMQLDGPEEGLDLIDRTFYSRKLAFFGQEPYSRWLAERDEDELELAYGFYVDQLRILLDQRPGRLLEKSPALLGYERILTRHMPDASIVVTHRDLSETIPSILSLNAVTRAVTHRFEPGELGPKLAEHVKGMVRGVLDAPGDSDRVIDVRYPDLVRDPYAVFRGLLERLGLSEPPDLVERVDAVQADLPRHKYGRHVYNLEQFGLTWSDFAELAHEYAERFDLHHHEIDDES